MKIFSIIHALVSRPEIIATRKMQQTWSYSKNALMMPAYLLLSYKAAVPFRLRLLNCLIRLSVPFLTLCFL